MRRGLWAWAAAWVLVGCGRCGSSAPAVGSLTRYLPRQAQGALVIPDLRILADRLGLLTQVKLATFLAGTQGAGSAQEWVDAVVAQVGLDLRSPEAILRAGIDPARGLGVAWVSADDAYFVVAISDGAAFDRALGALAKSRLGATPASPHAWAAPGGALQLAYASKDGFAVVAAGKSAAKVAGWAALSPEASLAQEPALASALARLGGAADAYAFLPAGSPLLQVRGVPLTATLALGRAGLTVRADAPWPNTRRSLEVLALKQGPDLTGLLPADAFLRARFQGDPALLGPYWQLAAGSALAQALEQAGLDVQKDVLEQLQPGQVAGVALAPTAKWAGGLPAIDVRRTNPFQFLQLVIASRVKDARRAQALLDKLPGAAPRFGAKVEPSVQGGKQRYLTTYAQGEGLDFALEGDTFVAAAPLPQLESALARIGAAAPGVHGEPLGGQALAAVLDLHQLADSVRALPSAAWGVGGFAIKATTVRWLEATDDLRAVTLGVAEKEGAVQAEVSLRFGLP